MKTMLLIINLVLSLYGTSPIFTTYDQLPEDRNGQVYVVVDVGICTDSSGNGILIDSWVDPEYNYMSYREVTGVQPGDIVYTFDIMNPYSNYDDDIVYRFDVIQN